MTVAGMSPDGASAWASRDDLGTAVTTTWDAETAPILATGAAVPILELDPSLQLERLGLGGRAWGDASKRAVDVFVAALLLTLFSPLLVLVALAIKLDSRGPVLFRCERVGRHGRTFAMLKLRKMYDDASGPPLTSTDDPRFTRVGRWLARSKIDEVPQLWNVLRGEMSLVGPRPEHSSFVRLLPVEFADIHRVRPGITGLSQLAFARESDILDPVDTVGDYMRRVLPQKISLDRLYVRRWTLTMDLQVLFWTALAVLMRGEVAVDRRTGRLGRRRPRAPAVATRAEGGT